MGDEDDGDALGGHVADGVQQRGGLFFGQHGRRLVQNQQLELVLAQFAGNLRELLVANGHIADTHIRVNLHAHFLNGLGGGLRDGLVIQRVQPLAEHLGKKGLFDRFPVQHDVFRRGKAGDQGEFLVDHADSGGQRVKGRIENGLLSV